VLGGECDICCCGVPGQFAGGNEVFEKIYKFPYPEIELQFCGDAFFIPDRFQVWVVDEDDQETSVFDSGPEGQQGKKCICFTKPPGARVKVQVDGLVSGAGTIWNFSIKCSCNVCKNNEPCGEGLDPCPEECGCDEEDGVCKQTCERNVDCDECEVCKDNFCEPDPECDYCDDENPCLPPCVCEEDIGSPPTDEKSPAGAGKCVCPDTCNDDEDCPDGQVCIDGICRDTCDTSEDCPDGQVCVDGVCRDPCNDDEDCPDGQICIDGVCQDGCGGNENCPEGQVCVDGVCRDTVACPGGAIACNKQCTPIINGRNLSDVPNIILDAGGNPIEQWNENVTGTPTLVPRAFFWDKREYGPQAWNFGIVGMNERDAVAVDLQCINGRVLATVNATRQDRRAFPGLLFHSLSWFDLLVVADADGCPVSIAFAGIAPLFQTRRRDGVDDPTVDLFPPNFQPNVTFDCNP